MRVLTSNIRYPSTASQNGVQGKVIVGFTIEVDGSVSNVYIKEGVDKDLDSEAVRIIKRMPKWTPASVNGEPVKTEWSLPIGFWMRN